MTGDSITGRSAGILRAVNSGFFPLQLKSC
ncbi:hypothetical protein PUN4_220027 [Paraburkholderia unamae]|nr:hypothetical protein PUN4_220027 [Paraburkholderia unamae]